MNADAAIDQVRVGAWIEAQVAKARAPFEYRLIAAGGSNLTYLVRDACDVTRILRRPPQTAALATAHDMGREWRIMAALASHAPQVPVPAMIAFCTDPTVSGAPFYLMEFVDGLILRDRAAAAGMSMRDAEQAMRSLVATQAALHALDPVAVGLGELGRHDAYVARQLRRWLRQVQDGAVRDLPLLLRIHEQLAANIPREQCRPALVHGDYRFDNTVLDASFAVRAVLDWELCTIGDPVADFFWSLLYWSEPQDTLCVLQDPPTSAPGFPGREAVVRCYAELTGFDLGDREFYTAFSWWKQACIVEGVYARMVRGATMGMRSAPPEAVALIVERYLERAAALLG